MQYKSNGAPMRTGGWAVNVANWLTGSDNYSNPEKSYLAKWFRQQAGDSDFLKSMSDSELAALLEQYFYKDSDKFAPFGNYWETFDLDSALADYNNMVNVYKAPPEAPDWNAIQQEAENAIARENADINSLYDANLARQTQLYRDQLDSNNRIYNDTSRQILSNDYQKNAQLMGTVGSSMDKARQNALEAGASAGIRLSSSINTLLSTQNKQAQQSLETSNNLAQQMLNQRQAAMGIRSAYGNTLNQDAQNRADLIKGNAERTSAYTRNQFDLAQNKYNAQMNDYEKAMSSQSSNPFYGAYSGYQQNQTYKNKYNQ